MRTIALLTITIVALGRAEAGRPSVARVAAKVGLDGPPTREAATPKQVGVLRERTWSNAQGRRWEYVKEVDGREVRRVEGIELANGRSLTIVRTPRGSAMTSKWMWKGTPIVQERYGTRSRRLSGHGPLRRMTGYGISRDGPLRFTSDLVGPHGDAQTLPHMRRVAAERGQPIEVELGGGLVRADPAGK